LFLDASDLKSVETLQHLGICHCDSILESILVHQNQCLFIDMGMYLRVPEGNNDSINDDPAVTEYHQDNTNKKQQSYSYCYKNNRFKNITS